MNDYAIIILRGDIMELRTLRYFLAVANEKNITKAADILHVTQPTLSRQISDLENELGTTLIIRGKRSLSLTEDGLLFKQRAEDIVEMATRTEQEFAAKSAAVSGVITLGATEAVGGQTLAKFMKLFSEKYPNIQFDLYNAMADNIKEKMEKGLADLGLLLEPVDTTKYEFIRLPHKETWGVLVNEKHPFSQKDFTKPKELKEQMLILPNRPNVRREILNWIGSDERLLHIVANYNLLSNVALLVEEDMGVAVCLDGALSIHHSPKLKFIPFLPEHTTKSVLVWKKEHLFNPATSLFIQTFRQYIEEE